PVRNQASGELVYTARPWVLRDSTLAPPVFHGPPVDASPMVFTNEYQLLTKGFRKVSGSLTDATDGTLVGFGLRSPDDDSNAPTPPGPTGTPASGVDSRPTLKPAMTVVYAGANDMLHAFRAAPSAPNSAGTCTRSATTDCGGEELWGFVPFDQLGKLAKAMGT